jgi:glycine betaine/proline transport system substrate-binding protein
MKPNKRRLWKLVSLLAACALLAAACGDGDDEETVADESTDASADDSTDTSADEADEGAAGDEAMEEGTLPGEGVSVTMGRADWATGYIQAAIYRQILTELGYEVSDPAELELGPSNAYTAMASGDFDFWTNSWYPGHLSWHQNELPDGTLVGDHLTIVDGLFQDSGVQGFLITKSVAEENGITSMQQVNDDPELVALFDDDGDGVADIYGCQESFTCDDIIENQIAFYGWDNIAQVKAGYDAMFAEATDKVNQGEPMMIYTWTPSSYVTELIPGVAE